MEFEKSEIEITNLRHKSAKGKALLRIFIEIHKWETLNHEIFKNTSSRDLYYSMVDDLINNKQNESSLRSHKGSTTLKASRQRIQSYEEMGMAIIAQSTSDGRTKKLIPTEKFIQLVEHHLNVLEQLHNDIL